MKAPLAFVGLGFIAALCIAEVPLRTQGNDVLLNKPAPAFVGSTASGKSYDLKSLVAKGPVFLYFIKQDCPVNARAVKFYNRIYQATGGNANFIGVINADADGYLAWSKRYSPPFPVVLDRNLKIIHAYRAERSPWVVQIGTDGKISNVWEGYSGDMLKELSARIGVKGPVDLTGAPDSASYG